MSRILLGCLWGLVSCASLYAQDYDQYKPLRNVGILPEEFIASPISKYEKELERVRDSKERAKDKNAKRDFYLHTTFAIDGLIRSGVVLIDEEYSTYLRELVHLLLKDEPELEKKIQVYAVRSPSVNALALANGTVLVNLGLIAQIENEAQLVSVLAHEIAHVEKEHSLDLYMKTVKFKRGENRQEIFQKTDGVDVKQFRRHLHSRENENDADNIGFQRFAKTKYRLANVNKVFDVLKYAHLPFDEVKFEKNFLEVEGTTIPNSFLLDEITPIKGQDENDDDEDKTHPNLGKRRENVNKLIAQVGRNSSEGEDYIISKTKFEKLQKIARFELPLITLHHHAFALTLYNAFLLSKMEKESFYVEKLRLKAFYGYAKYKTDEEFGSEDRLSDTKEMEKGTMSEGESQQVSQILYKKMSDNDVCLLAFLHAWNMYKKHPQDAEIAKMYRDLAWRLGDFFKEMGDLEKLANKVEAPNPSNPTPKDSLGIEKEKTKVEKIQENNANQKDTKPKKEKEKVNFKMAVAKLLEDEDFVKLYKDILERKAQDEKEKDKYEKQRKAEAKQRRKKGAKLGLDKIVVVTPKYVIVEPYTKNRPINFIESELKAKATNDMMMTQAKKMGLELVMLRKEELTNQDVDKFNDIVLLNDWFREQNDAGKMAIWGYQQKEIEAIAEKHGTEYFAWIGVVGSKQIRETFIIVVLFNVRTGQNEVVKYLYTSKKISDWLVNAHLYDALKQIKTKSKK